MSTTEAADLRFLARLPEDAFFRVLDGAPDGILLVDAHGAIRLVNAQIENLFGYTRKELLGLPIELLIPSRFRGGHVRHRERYASGPALRSMGSGLELFGLRKNGEEFPVEVSLSPVQTPDGLFIASSVRDISERKRIEAGAKLATQRLFSAVESIESMFALYDSEDRLVLCNSEFRQFFARVLAGPMVGRTFAELVDAALSHDLFELSGETRESLRERWLAYHRAPSGTIAFRTNEGHSLRLSDRQTAEGGVVETIWDVTDDVGREDELRQARALAEAASAAKSEFLSSMSHELRTPLNAVLGFAQLLQRDKKNPLTIRQKEMLEHILKGGEHLLRLIDDVLDLSRIEAGRVTISLEPVAVKDVIEEVLSTLGPMAARANVVLEVEPFPLDQARVLADRTRFAQVLMNFGSNAIKYGRGGDGTVHFQASTPKPGMLRLTVVDRGQGIPLEKQGKLFQPFQRAGQELGSIEGTGIGLAICKRLAELMGGGVGFRSQPGTGSEFWIELALHQDRVSVPPADIEAVQASSWAFAGAGEVCHTVVYIEDNPSNIAFMKELMDDFERVSLVTAPTAEVGLEIVRASHPDVVIMDINLPGMNGIEAARMLHDWPETRDIPVVALSAAAMKSDRQRAEASVFHRYLTKPVKVDELMATLEPLLRKS